MLKCDNCGTVGEPRAGGACIACGSQIAPPPDMSSATPPPYIPPTIELGAEPPSTPPAPEAPFAANSAHCTQCGSTLSVADRFCASCGTPTSTAPTSGVSNPAPPSATAPRTQGHAGPRRRVLIAAGAIGVLTLVAVVVIGLQARDDQAAVNASSGEHEAPATTTLAGRTEQLADQITARICPGEVCVDDSTPGVITVDSQPGGEYDNVLDDGELEDIAADLHVWSAADASRMLETRALDGTQTSVNGAVTWTYHPDSGLDIVIDVESLPTAG